MLRINEKGQSLIEVLVVGVVSAIMIIALVMIILSSLKNAQFAQNQTQATKLAQDTIDRIRILRDNNAYNTLTSPTVSKCFMELWNNTSGTDFFCGLPGKVCYYDLTESGTLAFLGNTDSPPFAKSVKIPDSIFTRQIQVSQPNRAVATDYVNVTVGVSWSDTSGAHSSDLETVITKPNYDCI
ncbi:MAG: hypothetical protein WCV81_03690 [Microgenomates group bacterium]|jgi:type II secretory pathway pseudopilin PulG